MDLNSNPNSHWASVFVEELAWQGLLAVCLAPGSRSTPLALAFAANPAISMYRHLDERSAAFFALGLALTSGTPVALVCTSGTAAANFHPAIIEAYYSRIPLLVLTADRPAELRYSGANQTIDQVKMYGDHVRWAVDAPTPQADAPAVVLRYMRTLAARAYAIASGIAPGPVHINFPFRKPLEPEPAANGEHPAPRVSKSPSIPYTTITRGKLQPGEEQVAAVTDLIAAHPQGLILCGPDRPTPHFGAAVAALAQRCGYPILADALSNVRHGPHVSHGQVAGSYHTWLARLREEFPRPTLVLRFGAVATSGVLAAYLNGVSPPHHWHIREDGEWADDLHLTHTFLQCDPTLFCEKIAEKLTNYPNLESSTWVNSILSLERETWCALEVALGKAAFFDGAAVSQLLGRLPDDAILFAGNSLPVRHVDAYDRPSDRRLTVFGNRGASGIDGNVSTALGVAAATDKRVIALLGDITFYHDMNGLLAIRQHQLKKVTFVVINNDGGGIFRRLPIAGHEPPFTDLFLTPHGLTFEHAAAMYGLRYHPVENENAFNVALDEAFANDSDPYLIEVKSDSMVDLQQQRQVEAEVAASYRQQISDHG